MLEEPQEPLGGSKHSWRQLPLLEQLGLVFANVPQAQAVRRAVEVSSKIFDCADCSSVVVCCE